MSAKASRLCVADRPLIRGDRTVMPIRSIHSLALALVFQLFWVVGAWAQAVDYRTTITGVEDELRQAISDSATLVALQGDSAPSLASLIRRAEDDVDRVTRALRAFGYYVGAVEITFDGRPPRDADSTSAQAGPIDVEISVAPGDQFTIATVELIDTADDTPVPPTRIDRANLGVAVGGPARSDAVLAAEPRLARAMRNLGYPFAQVTDRRAVVDFATGTMDVAYLLDFGPLAAFGAVEIEGLEQVDRDLVAGLAPFARGDRYAPEILADYRAALSDLGVFDSVRVRRGEALAADGQLPVIVTVSERKRRFIGFGADFATSEGFGANGFWGHRNLFGGAERLRLGLEVGRIGENDVEDYDYAGTLSFRKPAFLIPEQDLLATAEVREENLDAFDRTGANVTLGVERRLSDALTAGAGLSLEYEKVTDNTETTDRFTYVGLPLNLRWDGTDDLLDPSTGTRLTVGFTPYLQGLGSSQDLFRLRMTGSAYVDFGTGGETVLAGLVGAGALAGETLLDISADKRFFAGGGGTVRGYDFQSAGPLDGDDDPIGGRSLFHFSLELRQRVFGDFSLVPFVDGGTVFEREFPDFSEDLQFGAGIGVRYATAVGPLKFDLAAPLNGRDRDDAVAFYISLGQAF